MLKIKEVAQAFYKKNGAEKKESDLAKLLFPDSSANVQIQLLRRLSNGVAKTVKIEHIKMIAEFYQCEISDLF